MIVIGVTGSFASGKSEVARIFKKYGAKIFDADRAAHAQLAKGRPLYRSVVKLFGKDFLKKDGTLDRAKLGAHVFRHPAALKKLNLLIHPEVILEGMETIRRFKKRTGLLVLDVPLLFEAKMDRLADKVIVVAAKEGLMLQRAQKRGIPAETAKKILSSQWPMKRKIRHADFVIWNNGTKKELSTKVQRFLKEVTN